MQGTVLSQRQINIHECQADLEEDHMVLGRIYMWTYVDKICVPVIADFL